MVSLIKALMFVSVYIMVFWVIKELVNEKMYRKIRTRIDIENKKYIDKLIYQKNKKIIKKNKNILDYIYFLLVKTGFTENKYLWWLIPETVFIICILIFCISYYVFFPILKLKILVVIFSVPIAFIPIFILLVLSDVYEEKLERNLISYIIQLKNQVKINNDIISGFKETAKYAGNPLSTYIRIFLFEVNNGINVSVAFDNLKNKVNIERFRQLITNLDSCYINGGDFYNLLDKSQTVFLKVQEERNNRNEQTMSSRIVLVILIAMSVFVYFNFIDSNIENYNIMINDFIGRLILYWNFISIWIMVFLIIYVKKIDD